jgi:hypothetical protein
MTTARARGPIQMRQRRQPLVGQRAGGSLRRPLQAEGAGRQSRMWGRGVTPLDA